MTLRYLLLGLLLAITACGGGGGDPEPEPEPTPEVHPPVNCNVIPRPQACL